MSWLKKRKKGSFSIFLCCKSNYQKKLNISGKKKIKLIENKLEILVNKIGILEKEIDVLKKTNIDTIQKFSENHENISNKFKKLEIKAKDAEFITVNLSKNEKK